MTLNQILKRIESLSLGHKQVRTFRKGLLGDLFADKTAKYPAVCLQDLGGSISLAGHSTTINYRLFISDLVHVSENTKSNEEDVLSDMVSIAMDLLAQMNNSNYDDWRISPDNSLNFFVENENDLHAGCYFDFSVRFMYTQNVCQVPSEIAGYTPTDEEMKYIYDTSYTATGLEGNTLSIPELVGKKIVFMTRENSIIYKVSSSPDSAEYTWDNTVIGLGTVTNPGDRFLILYRNY